MAKNNELYLDVERIIQLWAGQLWSTADIAREMGCSSVTIQNRLKHARTRIEAALERGYTFKQASNRASISAPSARLLLQRKPGTTGAYRRHTK